MPSECGLTAACTRWPARAPWQPRWARLAARCPLPSPPPRAHTAVPPTASTPFRAVVGVKANPVGSDAYSANDVFYVHSGYSTKAVQRRAVSAWPLAGRGGGVAGGGWTAPGVVPPAEVPARARRRRTLMTRPLPAHCAPASRLPPAQQGDYSCTAGNKKDSIMQVGGGGAGRGGAAQHAACTLRRAHPSPPQQGAAPSEAGRLAGRSRRSAPPPRPTAPLSSPPWTHARRRAACPATRPGAMP